MEEEEHINDHNSPNLIDANQTLQEAKNIRINDIDDNM